MTGGGHETTSLNHLTGSGSVREWVDLVLEEQKLLARLGVVGRDRALHEQLLLRVGVTHRQLLEALLEVDPNA